MAEQDEIRTDLDNEVFNVFGKVVTLNSQSAPTYNERGEEELTVNSTSTVTIVPYSITDKELAQEQWGDIEQGDMEAAVRYSVTVNINDYFTIEGEEWRIAGISPNYLPDNVATIVRLTKKES